MSERRLRHARRGTAMRQLSENAPKGVALSTVVPPTSLGPAVIMAPAASVAGVASALADGRGGGSKKAWTGRFPAPRSDEADQTWSASLNVRSGTGGLWHSRTNSLSGKGG
jgi:hypothetical protein